jgi:hypothetical protein
VYTSFWDILYIIEPWNHCPVMWTKKFSQHVFYIII